MAAMIEQPTTRLALGQGDDRASGLAFTDDEHIVLSVIGKPSKPNVLRFFDLAACGRPIATFDRIRWGELLGISQLR